MFEGPFFFPFTSGAAVSAAPKGCPELKPRVGGGAILAYAAASAFAASVGSTLASMGAAYHVAVGMGAGLAAAGSLTMAFMAGRAAASVVAGWISDAWRGATPLLPGFFLPLSALTLSLYPWLTMYHGVAGALAVYLLWGFFNGLSWPPLQVLVASVPWKGKPSTSLSLYFAVGSLGFAVGFRLYPLAPSDVDAVRAGAALYLLSGAAALAGGLVAVDAMEGASVASSARARGASGVPRLALVTLAAALAVGGAQGLSREYLYVYLGEYKGLDKEAVSAILSHASLAAALSIMVVGAAADRLGIAPVLAADTLAGALGLALVAVPGAPALPGVVLAYFSIRSSMPLVRNAVVARGSGYEARIVGAANALGNIGAMITPPLAGMVAEYIDALGPLPGAAVPLLGVAAALAAAGVAAAMATPRRPRRPSGRP